MHVIDSKAMIIQPKGCGTEFSCAPQESKPLSKSNIFWKKSDSPAFHTRFSTHTFPRKIIPGILAGILVFFLGSLISCASNSELQPYIEQMDTYIHALYELEQPVTVPDELKSLVDLSYQQAIPSLKVELQQWRDKASHAEDTLNTFKIMKQSFQSLETQVNDIIYKAAREKALITYNQKRNSHPVLNGLDPSPYADFGVIPTHALYNATAEPKHIPDVTLTLDVYAARLEWITTQLVVLPFTKTLHNLQVHLKRVPFDATHLQVYQEIPVNHQEKSKLPGMHVFSNPSSRMVQQDESSDALVFIGNEDTDSTMLSDEESGIVWLRYKIPRGLQKGVYPLLVTITASSQEGATEPDLQQTLLIRLHIRDIILPSNLSPVDKLPTPFNHYLDKMRTTYQIDALSPQEQLAFLDIQENYEFLNQLHSLQLEYEKKKDAWNVSRIAPVLAEAETWLADPNVYENQPEMSILLQKKWGDLWEDLVSGAPQVYVMTMGPGEQMYTKWGHDALRVRHDAQDFDMVFNYGTFGFTPTFAQDFLEGKMRYWLSVASYEDVIDLYASENRCIWNQKLALSNPEIEKLAGFLIKNAQPQNRFYTYHHFNDNCSTRVRDAVDQFIGEPIKAQLQDKVDTTFRDYVQSATEGSLIITFLLDFLLNHTVDTRLTKYEETFSPLKLKEYLSTITRTDESLGTYPLVSMEETIYTAHPSREPSLWESMNLVLIMLLLFFIWGIGYPAFSLSNKKRHRAKLFISLTVFGLIFTIISTLLLIIMFYSAHDSVYYNESHFAIFVTDFILVVAAILILAKPSIARFLLWLWSGTKILLLLVVLFLHLIGVLDQNKVYIFGIMLVFAAGVYLISRRLKNIT